MLALMSKHSSLCHPVTSNIYECKKIMSGNTILSTSGFFSVSFSVAFKRVNLQENWEYCCCSLYQLCKFCIKTAVIGSVVTPIFHVKRNEIISYLPSSLSSFLCCINWKLLKWDVLILYPLHYCITFKTLL